jgi:hypothetical protein
MVNSTFFSSVTPPGSKKYTCMNGFISFPIPLKQQKHQWREQIIIDYGVPNKKNMDFFLSIIESLTQSLFLRACVLNQFI